MNNVENDIIQLAVHLVVIALLFIAAVLGAVASATIFHIRDRLITRPGEESLELGTRLHGITKIIRRVERVGQRPRVMVSGPEIRSNVCQICLGRIKGGSNYLQCQCGKTFHIICLSRTGFCPYCQEPYKKLSLQMDGQTIIMICPLCGNQLEVGSRMCDCGAIFQEEGMDFCCPICGTHISEEDSVCPYCGEVFDCYRLINCPVCGLLVDEGTRVCECNTVLGDRCPECGSLIGPEDSCCLRCGAEFEFV